MEAEPVSGSAFFGRKDLIDRLGKRFQAFESGYRHNIGLIGHPWAGKSSVLAQFLKSHRSKATIPVLIRIDETDSFQTFSQKWLGSILYSYQRFLELAPAKDYQTLVKQMRRRLPQVLKRMRIARRLADSKQFESSYREHIAMISTLAQESGKRVVLLLDEFDRLAELPLSDPFAQLGKEVMVQKDTMFIVTSSKPDDARHIFREKLSLLFSNFEVIEIGNLNFDEGEHWLTERLGSAFQDRFLRRVLLRITNAHPYYLDILIKRMESLLATREQKQITKPLIAQAFEEELFSHQGTLYQHFLMQVFQLTRNRFNVVYADVLLSIAMGKKKISQIAKFLGKTSDEIRKILQRLLNDQFVEKAGVFFAVPDSLYRFWLREVYYLKRASFDIDSSESHQTFRKSIEKTFEFFAKEDTKDVSRRIEELFRHFGNEMIELGRKKIKCPRFSDIQFKPTNGRVFPVIAKNQSTKWIFQVVRECAKEDDVRLFLEDMNKLRSPIQKKVIIALRGVELNAKLLAQESKIQLWDLRDLNTLLDLYNQPKLIL